MSEWIAEVLGRLILWAWPDLARLRADLQVTRREVRQARIELAQMRLKQTQQDKFVGEMGKLLMMHERALEYIRTADAAGATPAALDIRLAKVEMLLLPPLSDGALELTEAQERAIDRALDNAARAEVLS